MEIDIGPPTRLVILPFVVYLTCSEHREALALEKWVSRAPSDFPFIIYLMIKVQSVSCFSRNMESIDFIVF